MLQDDPVKGQVEELLQSHERQRNKGRGGRATIAPVQIIRELIVITPRVLQIAVVPLFFATLLNARETVSTSFAAAQTTKQQCMNTCRARYNDCRHLKQLPSSECRGVYQDCTKYSCTGLGPG